ncbi:MAG TPA: rhodanese-like domain-containing protein [Burkholderiaceae bacterium]|nr:rhodanese-like domain-containing protein [Burkholderiaceae bacterium]
MLEFLIQNWYLVLAAAVSGGLLLWPQLKGGGGGGSSVNIAEAIRLINREKAVLIDVSEPAEFAAGHPGGARNVPLGQLEGSKDLPSNKALPLVLVCPTGARASRAVSLLRKAGHEKVLSLAGGLRAWRDANLPVEKNAA